MMTAQKSALLPVGEMIQKIRDPNNWTDDFFKENRAAILSNWNVIRNSISKDGLYNRFDLAFCEWQRPGQAATVEQIKAVCDNGKARPTKQEKNADMVSLINAEEKEAHWIITDYVPEGQITTIAGDGGSGKTTVWCSIAAAISSGRRTFLESFLPDGFGGGKPQKVIFFSTEDSYEYTLRRRLRKNGANLGNILTIGISDERFQSVKFDGPFLEKIIDEHRPALCIFDPIQAFVPPNIKMGDRNAMRSCMAPLIGYGEKYGVTPLIIMHTNKQSGLWGRKRMADSADIWDISRSVIMAGETNTPGIRYLSHEKSNYGPTGKTVLYSIQDEVIQFEGYTEKKDRDFITAMDYSNRQTPARDDAKAFILEYLDGGEEKPVSDLDDMARAMSISKETLKRAKADLKREGQLKYRNSGQGRDKKFFVSLMSSGKAN